MFPLAGLGDQIGSGRERVEQFGAPRQMAIKAMQKEVPKDTLPGKATALGGAATAFANHRRCFEMWLH